jgi:hypothetical protein
MLLGQLQVVNKCGGWWALVMVVLWRQWMGIVDNGDGCGRSLWLVDDGQIEHWQTPMPIWAWAGDNMI